MGVGWDQYVDRWWRGNGSHLEEGMYQSRKVEEVTRRRIEIRRGGASCTSERLHVCVSVWMCAEVIHLWTIRVNLYDRKRNRKGGGFRRTVQVYFLQEIRVFDMQSVWHDMPSGRVVLILCVHVCVCVCVCVWECVACTHVFICKTHCWGTEGAGVVVSGLWPALVPSEETAFGSQTN